jgi:hypothetical protein
MVCLTTAAVQRHKASNKTATYMVRDSIEQAVHLLGTCWKARGSNSGADDNSRTRPDRAGAHPAFYTMGSESLSQR